MAKYEKRIRKLQMEIQELEHKIAVADSVNKPAYAKRLNMILAQQKIKLERWLRV
mgnify:CR=1 FL=1|jgi:hypothetical protein|tara:strand:+ start:6580 stop:6744 length:165 start_codon:yes stop_codon:yes gene_type:complete